MEKTNSKNPVAYFCTEFGIDNDLPTYSGGLGILAGDILNQAADEDFPMVGIGILYKGRQFMQQITGEGKEEKRDSEFDHDASFLRPTTHQRKPLIINIPSENNNVYAKVYQVRLSEKTILFFLSTDLDSNPKEWVSDMDTLYKGDDESVVRQQIILGIGGVRLLKKLGLKASVYHINEGRPCFVIWEIAKDIAEEKDIPFENAWDLAKRKIVYTNHTLIPAGNLKYDANIIRKWAQLFKKESNIDIDPEFLIKDGLEGNLFSITRFAIAISSLKSTVSKIHTEYAKKEWPNVDWITVTNGVHMARWQDSDFRKRTLNDEEIWNLHNIKKQELLQTVIKRTGIGYDPKKLVVCWARRLAEYKQPKIIFNNIDRLKKILTNTNRPVQLLFAGNSHSADPNAKGIIEEIIALFAKELWGSAIFIPNYNISLANHLTSGSDLWLNTPKGNLEACGTSGMKAIANGVLNCTVVDGWTHEVNWEGIGWTLDLENISESFYSLLENEIAPLYYERDANGLPIKWIQRMKASIEISRDFTTERVLEEYKKYLYFT